jgi:4-hydroxy-4-methyl-2-oxoglutarate aldolase
MDTLTEQLSRCNTAALFDVLRTHRLPLLELPRTIRGIDPTMKMAGPVFTVVGRPDPDIPADESLELWIREVLSGAPPGHVVVCQPNDHARSAMGDLSAEALRQRGIRGYYIDGGTRDAEEICRIGLPVFCSYTSPVDIVGTWRLEKTNVPIVIGGIPVRPGDYLLADRDGALVIPREVAARVITETLATTSLDTRMRTAIRSGRDPYDAFLEFRKL